MPAGTVVLTVAPREAWTLVVLNAGAEVARTVPVASVRVRDRSRLGPGQCGLAVAVRVPPGVVTV